MGEAEEGEPGAWPRKCRTSTGLPLNVAWHREAAKTHRCSFVKGIRWPGRAGGACGSAGVPRPVSSPGEAERVPGCTAGREGQPVCLHFPGERELKAFPGGPTVWEPKKADELSVKATSPPTEKSEQCSFPLLARREIPALPSQPPQKAAASFVPKGQFRRSTKSFTFEDQHTPLPRGGPIAVPARPLPLFPFRRAPTFPAFSSGAAAQGRHSPTSRRLPHFLACRCDILKNQGAFMLGASITAGGSSLFRRC